MQEPIALRCGPSGVRENTSSRIDCKTEGPLIELRTSARLRTQPAALEPVDKVPDAVRPVGPSASHRARSSLAKPSETSRDQPR